LPNTVGKGKLADFKDGQQLSVRVSRNAFRPQASRVDCRRRGEEGKGDGRLDWSGPFLRNPGRGEGISCAYEDKTFDRLAIRADALEEAGCTENQWSNYSDPQ
jgi:hypothetical protein